MATTGIENAAKYFKSFINFYDFCAISWWKFEGFDQNDEPFFDFNTTLSNLVNYTLK
jgi:hypothetical protein